jgi:hypothetical protein
MLSAAVLELPGLSDIVVALGNMFLLKRTSLSFTYRNGWLCCNPDHDHDTNSRAALPRSMTQASDPAQTKFNKSIYVMEESQDKRNSIRKWHYPTNPFGCDAARGGPEPQDIAQKVSLSVKVCIVAAIGRSHARSVLLTCCNPRLGGYNGRSTGPAVLRVLLAGHTGTPAGR